MSRSQGQTFGYGWKGLVICNTHVKYEGRIIKGSKVMDKVKVFEK